MTTLAKNKTTVEKDKVRDAIYARRDRFVQLAHEIHEHPELAFTEEYAAARIAEFLADEGFAVQKDVYGLPTAFVATIGSGPLHLVLCAEYDAADDSGPGLRHACGHNLIAGAAVAAASSLRGVADSVGLTVSVLGTPGEELLDNRKPPAGHLVSGKIVLLEAGAFEGVHAALMVHPAPSPYSSIVPSKAGVRLHARFSKAGAGESGFGAAWAQLLEEALRRAVSSVQQSLYFCTAEPQEENADVQADIFWGAPSLDEVMGARPVIRRCFEEAAARAGSTVEITEYRANAELRHDPLLTAAYRKNAEVLGRVREQERGTQEELRVLKSAALKNTLRHPGNLKRMFAFATHPPVGLFLDKLPVDVLYGTDLGNVSHVIPCIHPMIGIGGTAPNHTAAFAVQTDTDEAYRAMLDGGVALAWTALDAATDPP